MDETIARILISPSEDWANLAERIDPEEWDDLAIRLESVAILAARAAAYFEWIKAWDVAIAERAAHKAERNIRKALRYACL